jgi:glyoxylase-like metal-dependent hydrolase (beta-lactamase superfamily II)
MAIFTGDTLLIGGTGRTDFQMGNSQILYETLQKILVLPDTTIIYPGHNYQNQTKTTLGVEKLTNPRLKLVLEGKKEEFINLMNDHRPSKPELFEESLRWNAI